MKINILNNNQYNDYYSDFAITFTNSTIFVNKITIFMKFLIKQEKYYLNFYIENYRNYKDKKKINIITIVLDEECFWKLIKECNQKSDILFYILNSSFYKFFVFFLNNNNNNTNNNNEKSIDIYLINWILDYKSDISILVWINFFKNLKRQKFIINLYEIFFFIMFNIKNEIKQNHSSWLKIVNYIEYNRIINEFIVVKCKNQNFPFIICNNLISQEHLIIGFKKIIDYILFNINNNNINIISKKKDNNIDNLLIKKIFLCYIINNLQKYKYLFFYNNNINKNTEINLHKIFNNNIVIEQLLFLFNNNNYINILYKNKKTINNNKEIKELLSFYNIKTFKYLNVFFYEFQTLWKYMNNC